MSPNQTVTTNGKVPDAYLMNMNAIENPFSASKVWGISFRVLPISKFISISMPRIGVVVNRIRNTKMSINFDLDLTKNV